jgi:hypothetical protein
MKRAAIFLAVALAIPTSVAFARGPNPNAGGRSAPKVNYILKGDAVGLCASYEHHDSRQALELPRPGAA